MVVHWFIRQTNGMSGPFTSGEMRHLATCGQLTTADNVKRGEDGEWLSASNFPGMFWCAPVNAPFLHPNNMLSNNDSGTAAQFMHINGLAAR